MFDRFTNNTRRAMGLSRHASQELGHSFIGTEHILLGLLDLEDGVATQVLQTLGSAEEIRREVLSRIEAACAASKTSQLPFSPNAKRAIENTLEVAGGLGHDHIDTGHLVLGLMRVEDCVAAKALTSAGFGYKDVEDIVRNPDADYRDAEGAVNPSPGPRLLVPWSVSAHCRYEAMAMVAVAAALLAVGLDSGAETLRDLAIIGLAISTGARGLVELITGQSWQRYRVFRILCLALAFLAAGIILIVVLS